MEIQLQPTGSPKGSLQLEQSTPNSNKWVFPKYLHLYRFLSEVRASEGMGSTPEERATYLFSVSLTVSTMLEVLVKVKGKQSEKIWKTEKEK